MNNRRRKVLNRTTPMDITIDDGSGVKLGKYKLKKKGGLPLVRTMRECPMLQVDRACFVGKNICLELRPREENSKSKAKKIRVPYLSMNHEIKRKFNINGVGEIRVRFRR